MLAWDQPEVIIAGHRDYRQVIETTVECQQAADPTTGLDQTILRRLIVQQGMYSLLAPDAQF